MAATVKEVCLVKWREWSPSPGPVNPLSPLWMFLAARHGAGSRKAAPKRSMSIYGNDGMRRHFLLSESECWLTAPPVGSAADLQPDQRVSSSKRMLERRSDT